MSRVCTSKLIDAVEDGLLDSAEVLRNLLCWLSEDQVSEFCQDEYDEIIYGKVPEECFED